MDLEQFRQIVELARDVIVVTEAYPLDEPGPRIVYVNRAFTELTGYTPDEVIGRSPRFLQRSPSVDTQTTHAIRRGLESGDGFQGPILNYGKDGRPYWLDMRIFGLHDEQGHLTHFAAIERDVTARTLREMELHSAANTDPLTGLFNRRALDTMVTAAWDPEQRNCVAMVDLDRFKDVNDRAGHGVGDQVLIALADVLISVAGDPDYPVRLGGDEFVLVLISTSADEAQHRARRIQQELAYALASQGLPDCTVSLGVAAGHDDLHSMIARADEALLRAKQAGRNRLITA